MARPHSLKGGEASVTHLSNDISTSSGNDPRSLPVYSTSKETCGSHFAHEEAAHASVPLRVRASARNEDVGA